jgi:hypothetical protein
MAIRLALTALLGWMVALVCMTWAQMRVLRAQRDSECAALEYTRALVRERISELTRLNHELDFHMEVLRSSYPSVFKTDKTNQPANSSSPRQHHTPQVAQAGLQSLPNPPNAVADLMRPTP